MSETIRPGGLVITERALDYINLKFGSHVLDIGCGIGATVFMLRDRGFNAFGVDTILQSNPPPELICADAASLPFNDDSMDAVFFECSLSKINNPIAALEEAKRVLKSGSYLVVSDLFTRGSVHHLDGLLGRLEKWQDIRNQIESAGFFLRFFEEHADALATFWGQLILDYGLVEAKKMVCGYGNELISSDSSYFLAIFEAI